MVELDQTAQTMTLSEAKFGKQSVCQFFKSFANGATDRAVRGDIEAAAQLCSIRVDSNLTIVDWPLRIAKLDMTFIVVFDRTDMTLKFYGRTPRENRSLTAKCTAL